MRSIASTTWWHDTTAFLRESSFSASLDIRTNTRLSLGGSNQGSVSHDVTAPKITTRLTDIQYGFMSLNIT